MEKKKNNGMAIAGFVVGLVSLIILPLPAGITATILSAVGLTQINKDPKQGGKGMAIAGLVLGIISIVWGIYSIINAASLFR